MTDDRVEVVLSRPPATCYAAFCDVRFLTAWVPGLRRATVVRAMDDGRPLEIKFEHGPARTYSLVYEYDAEGHTVRFTPGAGAREAVRGEARFSAEGERTRMAYTLTGGAARTEIGAALAIAESFARWVESLPAGRPRGGA